MKESVKIPLEYPKGFLLQFKNCRILRDHRLQREDLWVRDGRIVNPEKVFFDEKISADLQIDCGGCIVAPGYIDVQLNGGFGVDFSDLSCNIQAGVETVAKILLEQGVTSFCPTIITSAPDVYHKLLSPIQKTPGSRNGAGVLGVHLEGPFISKEKKGAHPQKHICDLNGFKDLLDVYGCLDNVCLITLAPEYPGAMDAIQECVKRGIRVSLGHSMANLEKGEEAVIQGASFITHLFNAMLPFHHRDPHLVGLLASEKLPKDRTIFYGLIADGIHTHPAAIRIAQRVHPSGVVLVTDAMRAMGLPEGRYTFGEQSIDIIDHRSLLAGTDILAGSIAKMDFCVRNFVKYTDCGVVLALEAASLHPAQMLGISQQKGTLDFGTDADFILLDDDLNVKATYIAGIQVWSLTDAARNVVIDNDKLV